MFGKHKRKVVHHKRLVFGVVLFFHSMHFRPCSMPIGVFLKKEAGKFQFHLNTVSAPIQPWGSIFQNAFLTPDYHIKNAYKVDFSMKTEGVGFYSRVGLYSNRYGMFKIFQMSY